MTAKANATLSNINQRQKVTASNDPRSTMAALPQFVQRFLTFQTGKPLQGETELHLTPLHHLLKAIVVLFLGIALGAFAFASGWILLLPLSWLCTLHGLRCLRLPLYHQCAHENFTGNKRIDVLTGKIISMILVAQEYYDYAHEHQEDYHGPSNMTLDDPTVKSLLVLYGLRAGMTRKQCYRQLRRTLVSPSFHIRSIIERVIAHFQPASPTQRAISLSFYALILLLIAATGLWIPFLVIWIFPLVILYNISNTLRLCVKHVFPQSGETRKGVAYFSSLTYAIFLGDPLPSSELPKGALLKAWTIWALRLVFVHFLVRVCVLTGDTVCHDYHHAHGMSKEWPNYIYARDRVARASIEALNQHRHDCKNGCKNCEHKNRVNIWVYREVWTFTEAMNLVFDSLTQADPNYYDVNQIRLNKSYEIFTALDE